MTWGSPCICAGYMTVVLMTCCVLVGLLLMWRKPRWVAVATSRGTRRGRALQAGLSILFEVTLDQNSQLVFSLRSQRRCKKSRQSVLCQFPVSPILVPQFYTRLPCCAHLIMTHHFNATRANVSCARLRQASAPLLILVRSVSVPFVGTFAGGKSSLL